MITLPRANLVVSFIISTYNRRDILLRTLGSVRRCGLMPDAFEIAVVDNASTDGTAHAVAAAFPDVKVIALDKNLGSCAKNIALQQTCGRYVVFLDDDSFPHPGAVARMIEHFEADPDLGAAVFTINLLDGSRECSAYPDVFIGCGTGFRRRALMEVGALPADFFMQAEEYDLSLRLMDAGWTIRTFDDLHVTHLKTPSARRSWRTTRLDARNNFVIAMRYLPREWRSRFAWDWMNRYWQIAAAKGQKSAFAVGLAQGVSRTLRRRFASPVRDEVFQQFTRMEEIEQRLGKLKWTHNVAKILLLDYGKNILSYWHAASRCGMEVVAVADNRMAGIADYRGVPIVNESVARRLEFDAAIVSNSSPVHAAERVRRWSELDDRPVFDLLQVHAAEIDERLILPARKHAGLAA